MHFQWSLLCITWRYKQKLCSGVAMGRCKCTKTMLQNSCTLVCVSVSSLTSTITAKLCNLCPVNFQLQILSQHFMHKSGQLGMIKINSARCSHKSTFITEKIVSEKKVKGEIMYVLENGSRQQKRAAKMYKIYERSSRNEGKGPQSGSIQ